MAAKPSIPKGTRDFSPVEMAKRGLQNGENRQLSSGLFFRLVFA